MITAKDLNEETQNDMLLFIETAIIVRNRAGYKDLYYEVSDASVEEIKGELEKAGYDVTILSSSNGETDLLIRW